mmetsp:Transcript_35741/g.78009  ORF Transcript_35741/g.78009 Transcript_35741/m.78009 type:complete len:242 (+) Transcript_35741:808-1533(+)
MVEARCQRAKAPFWEAWPGNVAMVRASLPVGMGRRLSAGDSSHTSEKSATISSMTSEATKSSSFQKSSWRACTSAMSLAVTPMASSMPTVIIRRGFPRSFSRTAGMDLATPPMNGILRMLSHWVASLPVNLPSRIPNWMSSGSDSMLTPFFENTLAGLSSSGSSSPFPSPSPPPPVCRLTGGRPSPPLSPPPNASGGTAKSLNQPPFLAEDSSRDNGFTERAGLLRSPLRGTRLSTTDKES